jgi:hypothetical protein
VATDCCGNQSTCVQSVTLEDKTPPVFVSDLPWVVDEAVVIDAHVGHLGVIDPVRPLAQTFATKSEGTLAQVDVWIANEGAAAKAGGNLVLEVRAVTATGLPSDEAPLATVILPADSIPATPGWFSIPLANEVPVMPGDRLAIVLSVEDATERTRVSWLQSEGDAYPAGELLAMSAAGWIPATVKPIDAGFSIHVRPPVCGSNRKVQCGTPWTFTIPRATDACCGTNVTVTIRSTTTNGVCPQVITRVWVATDCCDNTRECVQTVTVVDATPPVLTCPANKQVRCGSQWVFDVPKVADACCGTNVTLTILTTVTNGICPQTVTRTWVARDCCGNTNTCSQTVTAVSGPRVVFTDIKLIGGKFAFTLPTETGETYVIEFKNRLSDVEWMPLQTIPGDGKEREVVDDALPTATRFYRVRVVVP